MLKVNDIFVSIDGEINYFHQGRTSTFIRFSGCNLHCSYCFGIVPGRRIPRLIASRGKNIKLHQIKKGDKLITFDDNKNMVETEVMEVIERNVTKWLRIKINNTDYYVTPEHPFFTNRGLVNAGDLKIGDEILHSTSNQKISFNKKLINPMFNPLVAKKSKMNTDYSEVGKKISAAIAKKKKNKTYKHVWEILEEDKKIITKEKIRNSKLGSKNPNWKGGVNVNLNEIKKQVKQGKINHCCICGKKTSSLDIHHKDGDCTNDKRSNLIPVCESCHYSTHKMGYNFWKGKRKDGKQLTALNGYEVQEIKEINIDSYCPSQKPKPLKVYNISCAPYNSYLIDYMWVHNCDADHESYQEYTPKELLKIVEGKGLKKVTITGGEPLLQKDLRKFIFLLTERQFMVSIETNGTIKIPIDILYLGNWIMDIKLPSSGCTKHVLDIDYYKSLPRNVFFKFCVQDLTDYESAKNVISCLNDKMYAISPIINSNKNWPTILAEIVIENRLECVYNLQIHKYLNLK